LGATEMTNEQIVKALADKLAVKITIRDDGAGKCCVDEPPDGCRIIYLLQKSSALKRFNQFKGSYISGSQDIWRVYGGKCGDNVIEFPRSAMAGIRWVEIE
jgi:hypothetical protein